MSNLEPAIKEEIDNMSYSQMIDLWRNQPFFTAKSEKYLEGETGVYFREVMFVKEELTSKNN